MLPRSDFAQRRRSVTKSASLKSNSFPIDVLPNHTRTVLEEPGIRPTGSVSDCLSHPQRPAPRAVATSGKSPSVPFFKGGSAKRRGISSKRNCKVRHHAIWVRVAQARKADRAGLTGPRGETATPVAPAGSAATPACRPPPATRRPVFGCPWGRSSPRAETWTGAPAAPGRFRSGP